MYIYTYIYYILFFCLIAVDKGCWHDTTSQGFVFFSVVSSVCFFLENRNFLPDFWLLGNHGRICGQYGISMLFGEYLLQS